MDKINGEIKRVIGSGGADHCDRIDFKLYDRTGAAGHSDGFYYWSDPSGGGNDVLHTGGGDVDVPGTGVSFIVPLSSVGGRKTLQFLVNEQEFEKEEETAMKDTDYELLVAIANQGYIDTVMDAARAAKAGGGTVIHAKGTGMELAKKYLGVSLVEEKEVILIVTKSREKNQIMKAIMEQAGLDSKERTIVFSLPVTSVAGIRMLEEDIQDDLL